MIALTKCTEFLARVGMSLYVKWHKGGSHERADRYRKHLAEIDKQKEAENETGK
jgi:hypothetical protein